MTETRPRPAADYVDGRFLDIPGDALVSRNPAAPDEVIWSGMPRADHVDMAVAAANVALGPWAALTLDERIGVLRRWQAVTAAGAERLAGLITDEMGKTLGESRIEARALAEKVNVTLDEVSLGRVRDYAVKVSDSRDGRCRFRPYGVMAVIGPFNFPAHLPNGQFIPALLTGNTVVFKPSEKTPGVGQMLAQMWHDVGLPPGVFNVVQGGGDVAASLVSDDDIAGVLFTGSWPVGRKIMQANLDRPGRMIALEMGGNNPAVVLDDAPLKLAVLECVRAAFATTGQRCTCTRRIIVQEGIAASFMSAFCKAATTILIGPGRSGDPVFMGPIVTDAARQNVLEHQARLVGAGGRIVVESTAPDFPGHFITPGVIEVDGFSLDDDCEIFGPLVQICSVGSIDEAIEQANATRYGLAASVFTADERRFEACFRHVNAGCINWNNGTAGASSKLPFGGRGRSGNNRPAAAFAADFCAYPVASMEERAADLAVPGGVEWNDRWIRP